MDQKAQIDRTSRPLRRRCCFVLLLCSQLACVTTRMGGGVPTADPSQLASATFSVDTTPYHLDVCRSGDREDFLGTDLEDRAGDAMVRLVIDPIDGPRLRVTRGAGGSREITILGRSQCRQLEAGFRSTGWRVNSVRDFSGSIDAECTSDAGLKISVHVRFEHCH